jgi:DNA-binding protein HU-beta
VNRKELMNATAAHTGVASKVVDQVLKGLTEVITAVNAKGEVVSIPGFAKFARVDRPARMGRNPSTGEAVKIKASKKAKITPLKAYKDGVMSATAAPKLAKGVWPPAPPAPKAAAPKVAAAPKPAAPRATVAAKPAAAAAKPAAAAAKPAAKAPVAAKAAAAKPAVAPRAAAANGAAARKAPARAKAAGTAKA